VKLEKTPVEVNDAPGFVSNRVLMPLLNEAMYAVMEGVATAEAVDEVFKLGMAHPMGPLTLADFIGLDVCLDIMRVLAGRVGRSEIPALSAADQDGGCGLAGTQERARISTPTRKIGT
jgi:3-hydroxyacyl-CoA dehydrogenase